VQYSNSVFSLFFDIDFLIIPAKDGSMKQNFTPNHLVAYLYNEVSLSDTLAIQEAMHQSPDLMEDFEELSHAYQQLPKVQFRPAPATIQKILKYSARSAAVSREA
jgi:hypothetical protein